MTNALIFIIEAISQIVLFIILLRFWMPWCRVDFHNAVAQGILRVTAPLVIPVRRILPSIGRVDTATVVIAFVIQYLTALIAFSMAGMFINVPDFYLHIAYQSLLMLAVMSCNLFMLIIFVHILLGWFAPHVHNPAVTLVHSMAHPVLQPFRRWVPAMGGFDISPIIPLILLGALRVLFYSWM